MVTVYDRNDRDLQSVGFKGYSSKDRFYFDLGEFNRVTKFDSKFLSITDLEKINRQFLETDYSGFIGIQPYTKNILRKEENFMWQLQDQGVIDHLTISFYV